MKTFRILFKILIIIFLFIESLVVSILKGLDNSVKWSGKVLMTIAPIAVYNILDHLYLITPKLTLYIIGLVNTWKNLLS